MAIQRALLSVSDKSGLFDFAKGLDKHGIELLSTGGTSKALREAGLTVIDVSDFTGAPELFEGRVKTLHPKVHGGLLYKRDDDDHLKQAEAKLAVLHEQRVDLSASFDQLLEEIGTGIRRMKVYRQMKLYNDPATNPALYKNN